MDAYELAGMLFGRKRAESGASSRPRDLTVSGTATSDSQDGLVSIVLDGDMTQAEDDGLEHDGSILVPTEVGVQEGDEVAVTMTGSDVSTVRVTGVVGNGDRQNAAIAAAQTVANAAQAVANAINQHFFADDGGIHVTEATQEDWDESHTGANVLINSIGQLFRDGLNNLLTLTTENGARALTIWDGLGNAAGNVLATFGENETHLGLGDGISSVFLANDKFRMRGVTQGRTPHGSSGTIYETYGNILAETVWDGPSQDEHWDSSTGRSYVSRAAIDTYALVPGNEANLKLSTKAMDWLGESPETRPSQSGEYGPDDFDPYISPDTMYEANIEIHSETANTANSSYIYMTSARIGYYADEVTYTMANGDNAWSTPAGTVIWSSNGWQMAANVTATLSYPISSCPSGIVLHWQAYASNATQDYDHVYTFIPKQHVAVSNGKGVVCQLANGGFGFVGTKYVYVSDGSITGHSSNTGTGTSSGITYANNHWVLTQVIAV